MTSELRFDIVGLVGLVVEVTQSELTRYAAEAGQEEVKDRNDLVTAADRSIEDRLSDLLAKLLPDSASAGEESGDRASNPRRYRWVIDPIDGTVDFARGYEFFTTVVCLIDQGDPLLSVVYQPVHDIVTVAIRGQDCSQWTDAKTGIGGRPPSRVLGVGAHQWDQSIHSLMLTPKISLTARSSLLALGDVLLEETLGFRVLVSQAYEALKLAEGGIGSVISLESSGGWTRDASRLMCETAGGTFAEIVCEADPKKRGFILADRGESLDRIEIHALTVGYRVAR